MRYVLLAPAFAFALWSGICEAEDLKEESASGVSAVVQEKEAPGDSAPDAERRHLDIGDDDKDEPVERIGVMSSGQNYDENTGLPDVVESDSSMDMR